MHADRALLTVAGRGWYLAILGAKHQGYERASDQRVRMRAGNALNSGTTRRQQPCVRARRTP